MLTNDDFYEEFLTAIGKFQVQYMIFGGFAANMYGFTRVTEDLDIWINLSPDNLLSFQKAILAMGFPEEEQLKNFISGKSIMLRLTDDAFRIDLLTKLDIKKTFTEAFEQAQVVEVPYGKIYFLSYNDLIDEKLRAKRPKDLIDIQQLRLLRGE